MSELRIAEAAPDDDGVPSLADFDIPAEPLRFAGTNDIVTIVPGGVGADWGPPATYQAEQVLDALRERVLATGERQGLARKSLAKRLGVGTLYLAGEARFQVRRLPAIAEFAELTSQEHSYVRLCSRIAWSQEEPQWSSCVQCAIRFLIAPSLKATKQFCGRDCQRDRHTRNPRIVGELRRYLWDEMHRRGVPEMDNMARAWGVSLSCANGYFTKPDRMLSRPQLTKIAQYLNEPIDRLIALQGGQTGDERRNDQARERYLNGESALAHVTQEQRVAAGKAGRGVKKGPMSAEHRASLELALYGNEELQARMRQNMVAARRRPGSRLQTAARTFRQHLGRQPTIEELAGFVGRKKAEADYRDLPEPWMLKHCKGALGMPVGVGRPQEIDYARVAEWRSQTPPVKWEVLAARLGRDSSVLRNGFSRWRAARV